MPSTKMLLYANKERAPIEAPKHPIGKPLANSPSDRPQTGEIGEIGKYTKIQENLDLGILLDFC